VPLRPAAVQILKCLIGVSLDEVFEVEAPTRDSYFRKAMKNKGLSGFRFHDSRHTAATSIAKSFLANKDTSPSEAILDLCKIFGWKDPKFALVYYNPPVEQIALRMADSAIE
jgi:integrase